MSGIRVRMPLEKFTDLEGKPLSLGSIYIGVAGKNPETDPVAIFWDEAMTIPASQPVKTKGGYPAYQGRASSLYVASAYSITVKDQRGLLVYSDLMVTDQASSGSQGYGSGGGVKNYFTYPDFEQGTTTGWNLGKDFGTTYPTSGGFGAGASGFSPLSLDSSSPLAGTASLVLTKPAANCQGSTLYSNDIKIDAEDTSVPLQIGFSMRTELAAAFASGDLQAFMWDVSAGGLIAVSISALEPTYGQPAKYLATFSPSRNLTYRLILMWVNAANLSALTVTLDSFALGPQTSIIGPAISNWVEYPLIVGATSAAPSKGSIVIDKAQWKRNGPNMDWTYDYKHNAAGTGGTGTYLFPLPTAWNIDLAKCPVGSVVGHGNASIAGDSLSPYSVILHVVVNDATTLKLVYVDPVSATTLLAYIGSPSLHFGFTILEYRLRASFPISGWLSNVNLATDTSEFSYNSSATTANDTTSFSQGVQGVAIQSFAPTLTTPIQKRVQWTRSAGKTDVPRLEFISPSGVPFQPSDLGWGFDDSAATYFGARLVNVSANQVDVMFYSAPSRVAGETWAALAAAGWYWRVRKVTNGNLSEQPIVVASDYSNDPGTPVNTPVKFSTKAPDSDSQFSTSTGLLTIAVPGTYLLSTALVAASAHTIIVQKNGAGTYRKLGTTQAGVLSGFPAIRVKAVAGDTFSIQDATGSTSASADAWFQAERIGS